MNAMTQMYERASRYGDTSLCNSLAYLDAKDKATMSATERMAYATICDVLEARHPHLDAILEAWCSEEGLSDGRTYAQVILANLTTR